MITSEYVRRNVTIQGRRTSISLERSIWAALEEICDREEMNFNQICTLIDHWRDGAGRTSAVRTFIINYYRNIVEKYESADAVSSAHSGTGASVKIKLGDELGRLIKGQN